MRLLSMVNGIQISLLNYVNCLSVKNNETNYTSK